jgi:hypothetical protein
VVKYIRNDPPKRPSHAGEIAAAVIMGIDPFAEPFSGSRKEAI